MPSPRAHSTHVARSLAVTLAVTLAITLAVALATLLPASAQATLLTDLQLSEVPADSAQLSFAGSAGEADLTLTELSAQGAQGAGSMAGSDQFGYLGLWLGSTGADGAYSMAFSQPVTVLVLSFIALTALGPNGQDGVETLGGFATNTGSQISFDSPLGNAAWDGQWLTPLDEDGRASLHFLAQGPGFTLLRFVHRQPVPLNGFVINRIQYASATPEPSTVLLAAAGGLFLLLARRRRPPAITGSSRAAGVHL